MTVQRRAPGLDVVRVAAIALVVLHHFRHLPGAPEGLRWFALRGYVGVDLFFVLSGWLVGGQLWRERARDGRVDVVRFWKRRWWRTLPAYYAVVALLAALGKVRGADLPAMAVFAQNHLAPKAWLASWSLCIEEQFYLALPLAVAGVATLKPTARTVAIVLASSVAAPVLLRAWTFAGSPPPDYDAFLETFYVRTHLRLDGLALGLAAAAVATYRPTSWGAAIVHRRALATIGIVLLATPWIPALGGATSDPAERMAWFNAVPGFLLVSLGTALCLPLASAWEAPAPVGRALARAADLAYATYLTHELARDAVSSIVGTSALPFVAWLAACVVASVAAATLLRRLVEEPGLRLRGGPIPHP